MKLENHSSPTDAAPASLHPRDPCHGCTACAGPSGAGGEPAASAALTGARLVGATALFFLLPLGIALAAAGLAGAGTERRSLAALAGLVLGMLLAMLGARAWSRRLAPARRNGHDA